MHPTFTATTALELWRERSHEAERRARLLRGAGPFPRTLPRRVLGRLAAWLRLPDRRSGARIEGPAALEA